MEIENFIIIKGGSYSNVKKALSQWVDLYSKDLIANMQFDLHNDAKGNHIIKVDKRIDNELFFYLVNYIKYPKNIQYKVDVQGFTKGDKNSKFDGQELLVYISETDKECDNVLIITKNNEHFKIDFRGKTQEIKGVKKFFVPQLNTLQKPDIIVATKNKSQNKNAKQPFPKSQKNFWLISLIIFVIAIINIGCLNFSQNIDLKRILSASIYIGVAFWFLIEHELLRISSFYFKCIILSAGLLLYGYFIKDYYQSEFYFAIDLMSLYPISLLLVQWPTRRLYKVICKREPIIDQYGKIPDTIYSMFLTFAPLFTIMLILDYIE